MKILFRKFSYLHLVQHEPGHPRITPLSAGFFMSRCAHSASTGVPRVVEALEARCGIFTKASCAWMQIVVAKGDDGWASVDRAEDRGNSTYLKTWERGLGVGIAAERRTTQRLTLVFCPAHAPRCLAASRRHLSAGRLTRFQSHSQRVPAGHRLDSFICSLLQPLAAC